MLKRKIVILIAGGLLGAQVTLAAAAQGAFPPSADTQYFEQLPAQEKYFAQRAAANPNPTGASGTVFPPSADDTAYWNTLPALTKYLEQRAASPLTGTSGIRFSTANPFDTTLTD